MALAVLSAPVPTGRRAVAAVVVVLLPLLVMGCSLAAGTGDKLTPAGPRMCGFMTKAQLTRTVGEIKDLADGGDTTYEACDWRVVGSDPQDPLRPTNNGMVIWMTEKSAIDDPAEDFDETTIDGHPAFVAQTPRSTLIAVSTSDDLEAPGFAGVSLRRGGPEGKRTATALARAALAYALAQR